MLENPASKKLSRTLQAPSRRSTEGRVSAIGQPATAKNSSSPSGAEPGSAPVRGKQVSFPWPPKVLSPNFRAHWAAKSKAAKAYRTECAWLTKAAGMRVDWDGFVHLWITFYPPDRRHRDMDNCISSGKSLFDGIADALSVNDKQFRLHPFLSDEVAKGGSVVVRLSKGIEE